MKKIIWSLVFLITISYGFSQSTYELGKVYDVNGVKGLVYKVSADGKHGKMMSLKMCSEKVWLKDKAYDQNTRAFDAQNGKNNMQTLAKFIKDNDLSWDILPLFKWANELGDGWYIPAKDELAELAVFISGSKERKIDKDRIKELNKLIKDNNGDGLDKIVGYTRMLYLLYSSTEATNTDKKGNKMFFTVDEVNNTLRDSGWKKVKAMPGGLAGSRAILEF